MSLRNLVLGTLIACQSVAATAQNQLVLDKLRELDASAPKPSSEIVRNAVAASAKAFGEANGACVPKDVVIGDVTPVTGASGILSAVLSGQLRNAWVVYATHGGCPGTSEFRYLLVQQSDGTLLAPQVNEGRSFANPSIMRDASAPAALAALQKARTADAACTGEKMKMGPTKVVKQSADLGPDLYGARYTGSWSELWRFETCGRMIDVPIDFVPDGDGGARYDIGGDAAVLIE